MTFIRFFKHLQSQLLSPQNNSDGLTQKKLSRTMSGSQLASHSGSHYYPESSVAEKTEEPSSIQPCVGVDLTDGNVVWAIRALSAFSEYSGGLSTHEKVLEVSCTSFLG